MTVNDIYDLNGRTPKIGDKIVMSDGWTTGNSFVMTGVVKEFIEKPKTLKMIITVEKSGLYGYRPNTRYVEYEKTIGFPSDHIKFVIIS
jgi:hypothetical protein